jgi:hypothetical protein
MCVMGVGALSFRWDRDYFTLDGWGRLRLPRLALYPFYCQPQCRNRRFKFNGVYVVLYADSLYGVGDNFAISIIYRLRCSGAGCCRSELSARVSSNHAADIQIMDGAVVPLCKFGHYKTKWLPIM